MAWRCSACTIPAKGDDPLEALSGSNGLCADTTIVLDQDQNGRTLYVRGRDVEEKETAVIFANGSWSQLGDAADVRRSGERSVIVASPCRLSKSPTQQANRGQMCANC